ncbi:MAG: hypothetical protein KJN76_01685 [Eudoraea sp.]|nr:hypothetical protein [Eudoraea sp.]
MKNLIISSLLFFSGFVLTAQIQNAEFTTLNDLQFYVRTNNESYNTAEGSRYLNDAFLPARINGIQNTQLVRFNVPDNMVEVKKNNNEIMVLSFSEGYTIILQDGSNKVYETHSFINHEGKNETTFLEKLFEKGEFKLFLKEQIKFTPAKAAKSGYEPAKPAKFTKGNDTFFVSGLTKDTKTLKALPKKRKNLLPHFGEHASAMEKKIKSEKLDIKDKDDLTVLFKAYLELL